MRTTTLIAIGAVLILPGGLFAQSLGQVAADEAARRKAIATPAKVITADDIKPADPVSSPTEVPPFPSDVAGAADDPASARVFVAPARLQGGAMPDLPLLAVAGGEVLLEVDVTREGGVGDIHAFRVTPPFTEALVAAVKGWRFQPAEDAATPPPGGTIDDTTRRKVDSKVLVVGLFRPPSIYQGTLGEPPANAGAPSDGVAVPRGALTMPGYPPQALFNGVVLLELAAKADGAVGAAKVVRGAAPFDALALEAVRGLSFRPPRVHGRNAPTNVYVAVGFRQPITP